MTLLDLLRERLALTGTKKGCDRGQCGACTVLVDGRRINACLALAVSLDGAEVADDRGPRRTASRLHPVQAAFIAHDGFQCGFCTPGQIMSAVGLIREGEAGDDPERIREGMSGNLCRCGAYAGITEAVLEAQKRHRRRTNGGSHEPLRLRPARPRWPRRSRPLPSPGAAYLAAGTNLLDLMKTGAARPGRLVDVTRLPGLDRIEMLPDGGVRIGAMVRNADLARDRAFARAYPAVAEALLSGASPQLRNAATVGGNLHAAHALRLFPRPRQRLQPARARRGLRRARAARTARHAVLGWSDACIATHPSDFCVPLVALDAVVEIEGPAGRRERAARGASTCLPGDSPERESVLAPGELIVALRLPAEAAGFRAHCPLPEAARAHLLCLRAGLGRRGAARSKAGRSARRASRSAASRRSPGAPAPRRRCSRAPRRRATPSPAPPRRRSPTRGRRATTPSRSSSPSASSARALLLAAAGTPERMPALPASVFA